MSMKFSLKKAKKHLLAGIAIFFVLLGYAFATRKDPFWFGKVTALMSFVLFALVLVDTVIEP